MRHFPHYNTDMQEYVCPPQIYKYTPLAGLKATLENRSFKLSRPSDFNDPIDMYLQETIGQNMEEFLEDLKKEFHDYLTNGIKDRPSNNPSYSGILNFMHQAIDKAPEDKKEKFRKELLNTPIEQMYDFNRLRKTNDEIITAMNTAFSFDAVFCSTTDSNNLLMWAHYADHHRGAVIEYTPNVEKDSVFLASKPVQYSKERPLPYRDAAAMVAGLEKNPSETVQDIIERLVYTKSEEWVYEKEYRLFVPFMLRPEQEYTTLKFHSEELTSIYFGCRMSEKDMTEMKTLALSINPEVRYYRAFIMPKAYGVEYKEIK